MVRLFPFCSPDGLLHHKGFAWTRPVEKSETRRKRREPEAVVVQIISSFRIQQQVADRGYLDIDFDVVLVSCLLEAGTLENTETLWYGILKALNEIIQF